MSKYYHFKSHGVDIKTTPAPFWRSLWRFPLVTGDDIALKVVAAGVYDVPVLDISFNLEYEGNIVGKIEFPLQAQYKLGFSRYGGNGEYEIIMECRVSASQTPQDFNPHYFREKVATVHMIENWKPFVAIVNLIVGSLVTLIIGVIILC